MFSFKKEKRKASPSHCGRTGFTLVELLVTLGIFIFMTTLLVAKYGSFNDGTLLTSMSYDVALSLRNAQAYGINVQGYNSTNAFTYPYGIHFNSSSSGALNTQIFLFADSIGPDGVCTDSSGTAVCTGTQTTGDGIVAAYTLARGGLVSSVCVGTAPGSGTCVAPTTGIVDITFKRPNPNAIITAKNSSGVETIYPYAEIHVMNASKTSARTIVVRVTGEIAILNQ
jgi:type II secretory pathway pseudopilin PulG